MQDSGFAIAFVALAVAVAGVLAFLVVSNRRRERGAAAALERWARGRGIDLSAASGVLPAAYGTRRPGRWSPTLEGAYRGCGVALALEGGTLIDEAPRAIALYVLASPPTPGRWGILVGPVGLPAGRIRERLVPTGDAAFDAEFAVWTGVPDRDPRRLAAFALHDPQALTALRRFGGVDADADGRLCVRWPGWDADPATLDAALDLALAAAVQTPP